MLEPLVMGYIHCAAVFESYPTQFDSTFSRPCQFDFVTFFLVEQLSTIVRCFESTRCSFGLLQELDFAGYSSLALALTEYNPIIIHEKPWYAPIPIILSS